MKLAPYVYTPKTTKYQQTERSRNVLFQNGGQKIIFISQNVTRPKFEKPFSQWNFSIKFGSQMQNMNTFTYSVQKWRPKQVFDTAQ